MPSSHETVAPRRILGLFVSIVLACGICPVTAFASADNLVATAISPSQDAAYRAPSTQASSSAKFAKVTTKKSAAYSLKKYTKAKGYANVWYVKPTVKGSSRAVKKIDKSLQKRYRVWAKGITSAILASAKADYESSGRVMYQNTVDASVSYNKKGYFSVKYEGLWYGGGMSVDRRPGGDVYSLKTGKKLNVSQVVAGNATQVKHKIADLAVSTYGPAGAYTESDMRKAIMAKKISDIEFYLEDGNVIVCFDSYEINQGWMGVQLTLKGDYA